MKEITLQSLTNFLFESLHARIYMFYIGLVLTGENVIPFLFFSKRKDVFSVLYIPQIHIITIISF